MTPIAHRYPINSNPLIMSIATAVAVYAERNGPATALVQHDHGIRDRNESGG